MTTVGLRRDALEQIVVLVQGFARLATLAAALAAVLGPLGLPSQDFASTLRAAYFGFSVGGVTISLSTMLGAGVLLVLGVIATRAAQKLAQRALSAAHPARRGCPELDPDDLRLRRPGPRVVGQRRHARARPAEIRARGRALSSASALVAGHRQQFRFRPDSALGARHPRRRLGRRGRRAGFCAPHQRASDGNRDFRARHPDRAQLDPGDRARSRTGCTPIASRGSS